MNAGGRVRVSISMLVVAIAASSCRDATVVVGTFSSPPTGSVIQRSSDAGAGPGASRVDSAAPEAGGAARDPGPPAAMMDSGADMQPATDAATPALQYGFNVEPGSRDDFCRGTGPAVRRLIDNVPANCGAGLGRWLFHQAMCSCTDLVLGDTNFTVDAFDSRAGSFNVGEGGAAVGVNHGLGSLSDMTSFGGSLIVAGGLMPSFNRSRFVVAGDFLTNATLDAESGEFRILRDFWLDADAVSTTPVLVGRDAYQSPGHFGATSFSAASVRQRSFSIDAPCRCGGDSQFDIKAVVAAVHARNDNAAVGLNKDAFTNMISTVPVEIPCGRLALNNVNVVGSSLPIVNGRTALFIDGDFQVVGSFAAALGPQGELDVFVTGNLTFVVNNSNGAPVVGSPSRPSALRFYVAGSQGIVVTSGGSFAAQVYAPSAPFALAGTAANYGSVFANSISALGAQVLHYDRSIVELGESCDASQPAPCVGRDECAGGRACIQGQCGDCRGDEDCSRPLVCTSGRCQPLALPLP